MVFNCEKITARKKEKWTGVISSILKKNGYCEIWIKSRSSIMIIFGTTSIGGFACIPDFKVGCHLVNLKDKFWNNEQLVSILGNVDGITVASTLHTLATKHNIII